jgi:predicted esterase
MISHPFRPLLYVLPIVVALVGCGRDGGDQESKKQGDPGGSAQERGAKGGGRDDGHGKDNGDQGKSGSGAVTAAATAKPLPPLNLSVPSPLPEKLDGMDLQSMSAGELIGRANEAMDGSEWARAATYQYWYVQKSKRGRYNLACFLARTGKVEPAFYWLQVAALEDGVDANHAQRDSDLESLRRDGRWAKVRNFLIACNRYFETSPIRETLLVLPTGYKKETPIPAILWLHGLGSTPGDFVNPGAQPYADKLNVALVGVSGTKARGPRSFVWAEKPDIDAKRLGEALAEVSDRVTIKKGHIVTFGFSQGAQVGLDVAVRDPKTYAGSIVLSPGAVPHLEGLTPSPLLAGRGFVVSCGAEEMRGNVRLTAEDADWLRTAKANVIHKAYPGEKAHAFPVDFNERFPEWVTFILKARKD